jgi:hypothetical protein
MIKTQVRVPVVSADDTPLTPCKPSKARKLVQNGLATKHWSKLGIFFVKLNFSPTSKHNNGQQIVLGLDTGSKFDGVVVVSKNLVLQTGMLELPKNIARRIKQRSQMRHLRRSRKCRRRPRRFNNRKRLKGWIAPSQEAKVDFRLKVVGELAKLYPVTEVVVEDVRFDHYRKRWGKSFSTVEIGKTRVYDKLRKSFKLKLVEGAETARLRRRFHIKKSSNKRERSVWSHAVDALVIAADTTKLKHLEAPSFYVWRRLQYPCRQLHKLQPAEGAKRRREGGSASLGFRKGDVVRWRGRLARVGGYLDDTVSLHAFDVDGKRFTQKAKPNECSKLFNQKIMYAIPPTAKVRGHP